MNFLIKRLFSSFLISIFVLSLCLCGCQKEYLPIPNYPLTSDAISTVLAECDMSHAVVANEPILETDFQGGSFALYEEPDDTIAYAGISNAVQDGERTLGCIFINLNMDSDITEDECKQAILFATRLLGGFRTETQVYDIFQKKFNPENGLIWETEIDDIYCRIKFDKVNDSTNYVLNVRFATDPDTFGLSKD